MKGTYFKKVIYLILISILLSTSTSALTIRNEESPVIMGETDLDELVDVNVTVEIKQIRSLEKYDLSIPTIEKIDLHGDPDFYVKVFINDAEFTSNVWHNRKYVDNPGWSATLNVPDDEDLVDIKIQLWDWNIGLDRICDISRDYDGFNDNYDIEITYDIKTGNWFGDDFISAELTNFDLSGYGRLNGCDDNSIYQLDRDCELWFDIYQNDYDGDGIPSWTELNIYNTDPEVDNTGEDLDEDGVPIEWEHHWGQYFSYDWHEDKYYRIWFYDPYVWEDHENLDIDNDGLSNVEEYLTSQWGSDPFRKDLFVELDIMENGPNGEKVIFPEKSKELLQTAYDRQNIVYHLDDGYMGGSDTIPFSELVEQEGLQKIYQDYFLHNNENNWRRGIFHYGLIVYRSTFRGFVFWGGVGPYLDSFQISSNLVEQQIYPFKSRKDVALASVFMHETGHTLGIFNGNTPGCDDQLGRYPWEKNWWKWGPYKSCMNYRYTYRMVDYSDGSRGKNDFDDWNRIDLTFFQREMW